MGQYVEGKRPGDRVVPRPAGPNLVGPGPHGIEGNTGDVQGAFPRLRLDRLARPEPHGFQVFGRPNFGPPAWRPTTVVNRFRHRVIQRPSGPLDPRHVLAQPTFEKLV